MRFFNQFAIVRIEDKYGSYVANMSWFGNILPIIIAVKST